MLKNIKSMDILSKYTLFLRKRRFYRGGENIISWDVVILVISKSFANSEFQMFEPNFKIGAVTIELLQTSSQH